ncbi:MAG TPA: thiamine phosphate synthase [Terriglobales bacterium]|nr:thiamine phosphate synthase [Terriglobales bacterium]
MIELSRLYAILDASCFPDPSALMTFADTLRAAGVELFQYRNKSGNSRQMLSHARELRRTLPRATLIMNDRADLCLAAGFKGVHLGQNDLPVEQGRTVVGNDLWIGVSTHNPEQVSLADATSADYLAIGPVFATKSKANPDPVIGVAGIRAARALTRKPLVAIGGITRANCRAALEAGANSVAVISDLLESPRQAAAEFLRELR